MNECTRKTKEKIRSCFVRLRVRGSTVNITVRYEWNSGKSIHMCVTVSVKLIEKCYTVDGVRCACTFSKVEKPAKYHVTHVCTVRKLCQAFALNRNRDDLLHSNKICILKWFTLEKTEMWSISLLFCVVVDEHDRNCRQRNLNTKGCSLWGPKWVRLIDNDNNSNNNHDKQNWQPSNECEPANQLVHNALQTYKCFN